MLRLGSHMECGKVGTIAASFTVSAMGSEWLQRSGQITNPVNKPYGLDTVGAKFGDSGTMF